MTFGQAALAGDLRSLLVANSLKGICFTCELALRVVLRKHRKVFGRPVCKVLFVVLGLQGSTGSIVSYSLCSRNV